MNPQEIKDLKAKHGAGLKMLNVTTEDGTEHEFVLKKPTRLVIQAIAATKGNETKSSDLMIENCVVGGDKEALNDGEVFVAVLDEIGKLFGAATTTIKKL